MGGGGGLGGGLWRAGGGGDGRGMCVGWVGVKEDESVCVFGGGGEEEG